MTRPLLLAILMTLAAAPAMAKNFAVPSDDPAVTIALPDDWTPVDIDYGYSAQSPDKDVFMSVESAGGKDIDGMTDLNKSWLKENDIKLQGEAEKQKDTVNGLDVDILQYQGTDDEGPTKVDFAFIAAGKGRVIMLTLWGSTEERKAHADEIGKIISSIKPIQ